MWNLQSLCASHHWAHETPHHWMVYSNHRKIVAERTPRCYATVHKVQQLIITLTILSSNTHLWSFVLYIWTHKIQKRESPQTDIWSGLIKLSLLQECLTSSIIGFSMQKYSYLRPISVFKQNVPYANQNLNLI